ncbi:MAG: sulfurtransferase-like selenium metabolism protein YedF [Thermodesulfobacteriota bacterium]
MKEIDCRGLACPQPVVTTKKALEEMGSGELVVIVDNPTARDNVERFAKSQGAKVDIEKKGEDFFLHIQKEGLREREGLDEKVPKVVVYVNSNLMGVGEEALGAILMRSFLKTLLDLKPVPSKLIFVNSGVRLTTEGSEVLESLKALSEKGVQILSCGTCLDFYGLKEKLRVGIISNMFDIAQSLLQADRLVKP